MIEYGLSVSVSVSLDGTPRTPRCCDYGPSPKNNAPRKYMTFGNFAEGGGGDGGDGGDGGHGGHGVSVSPRVLFSDVAVVAAARRLDFDNTELSPVSFASASASASASVGDCGVCYNALPRRSNHVFTLCGHLFCVSCLLKWCDVNMTCPICRADLIESVAADKDVAAAAASAAVDEDDDDEHLEVERLQLQTQAALNDRVYSDSDSDSDSDGGSELYMLRWSL